MWSDRPLSERNPEFEREQKVKDDYQELRSSGFRHFEGLGWLNHEQYCQAREEAEEGGVTHLPKLTAEDFCGVRDLS